MKKISIIAMSLIVSACSTSPLLLERAKQVQYVDAPIGEYVVLGTVETEKKGRWNPKGELLQDLKLKAATKYKGASLLLTNFESKVIEKSRTISKNEKQCSKKDLSHLSKAEQLNLNAKAQAPVDCYNVAKQTIRKREYAYASADVIKLKE